MGIIIPPVYVVEIPGDNILEENTYEVVDGKQRFLTAMHLRLVVLVGKGLLHLALDPLDDVARAHVAGALEHQMLQQVRPAGRRRRVRFEDDLPVAPLHRPAHHPDVQFLFLDSKTETLRKRYSETRRRHPLASDERTLSESIAEERVRLARVAELGHHIDTSDLKPNALREWIRQFITANGDGHEPQTLTLSFESFGFKHGLPLDAELVFDVRCLPNPHYEPDLRPLTGRDQPVIDFLEAEPDVLKMRDDIAHFVETWLPAYIRDNRSYLTVGIGCTGGQHRSVYIAEWLARHFADRARVLVRHRELTPALTGAA